MHVSIDQNTSHDVPAILRLPAGVSFLGEKTYHLWVKNIVSLCRKRQHGVTKVAAAAENSLPGSKALVNSRAQELQ